MSEQWKVEDMKIKHFSNTNFFRVICNHVQTARSRFDLMAEIDANLDTLLCRSASQYHLTGCVTRNQGGKSDD